MDLCMIGVRGHCGYVFDSIDEAGDVRVVGYCGGDADCADDLSPLEEMIRPQSLEAKRFADWREMLDACKPDVLCVAGPLELNATICIEACKRGIHIFCEKPAAITLADLDALQAAHAANPVHLAMMMGLRYDPGFCTAWQAVRDGAVGTVRLINTRKSYKLGERAEFYRQRETYGGTIPWVGAHAIDWIHWLTGAPFESVFATHSRFENRGHGDLEVSALCHFTLAGEISASASIDYYRPAGAPSHGDDWFRVVGSTGVIEAGGERVTLTDAEGQRELTPSCERKIFSDFVAHVRGERTAWITSDDTFAVTRACLLARQSADEGQMIRFREQE